MIQKSIICAEEFIAWTRAASVHLDEKEVEPFIDEAEQMFIIPAIGFSLFEWLVYPDKEKPDYLDDEFDVDIIINGGAYDSGCCGSERKFCKGLKAATSYYAYAKMARADGSIIARAGYMRHRDDYADHVDDSKLKQYNDVMDIAEAYLAQCVDYINAHKSGCVKNRVKPTRAKIKAIGK